MGSEIKNTISLLCKLLNLLYKTNLKPEYFRLAKFNKRDENVVPVLWNLIHKVLNEDNTVIVKKKLHELNYKRDEFYSCTELNCESRELLLVIGFLTAILLDSILNNEIKKSVFSKTFIPYKNPKCSHHTNRNQRFEWQKLNRHELENYRKWLCGKICANKNMISEYTHNISKMEKQFNSALNIKANGKLTVFEILALKNKAVGEEFIEGAEPLLSILGVYTEWLKQEKYFWKWMESVVTLVGRHSECSTNEGG